MRLRLSLAPASRSSSAELRAGVEGLATVRVQLDPAGAVIAVQLVQSAGSRLLDEAALAAAHASRFAPATRGQVRVSSEALATYRFELR